MNKINKVLIMFFFLLILFNNQAQDQVVENEMIETQSSLPDSTMKIRWCEKLNSLSYPIPSYYLAQLIDSLNYVTGVIDSANYGYNGVTYLSEKKFRNDLKRWKNALGCTNP